MGRIDTLFLYDNRSPGISRRDLEAALREQGLRFQKGDESKAAQIGIDRLLIKVEIGAKGAKSYSPIASNVPTSPTLPKLPPGMPTTFPAALGAKLAFAER